MKEIVLDVENVSFSYKEEERLSLNCVNLKVHKGELVVLCGESGCGKSTMIRLMNGLIPFYYKGQLQGEIRVLGDLTKDSDVYHLGSRVATVFQNPRSQFFCVDVRSELAFEAENLNFDREDIIRKIHHVSHELGIEKLLNKTMFQLSGGEKQKIACASVSITDSPIVVLDEPSSNLDRKAIAELKEMIRFWKEQGKTVVIAEHRLYYLKDLADRFIYMKKGAIVQEYRSEEIKELAPEALMDMGLRALSYDGLTIGNEGKSNQLMRIRDFAFRYKGMKNMSLTIPELDIPKTSVIAIIGRNGAGKSTFVRCLCGLEKRAKGILKDGEDKLNTKRRLNRSFLVMQDVNRQLFTESVEEEISLGMEEKSLELLERVLKEFDLYDERKRHPMSLSGGQKQRVAIACAVASARDYIIFDEPTSGLDYFHMEQVASCIKELQKKDKTIWLITHDIELIYSCCNYVIWMEDGRVRDLFPMDKENEPKLRAVTV